MITRLLNTCLPAKSEKELGEIMMSMRVLSKFLETDPDELNGSHCSVQWEKEGNSGNVNLGRLKNSTVCFERV